MFQKIWKGGGSGMKTNNFWWWTNCGRKVNELKNYDKELAHFLFDTNFQILMILLTVQVRPVEQIKRMKKLSKVIQVIFKKPNSADESDTKLARSFWRDMILKISTY